MALGLTPYQIIEKGTHPLLAKPNEWERIELEYIASVQNGFAFSSKLFNHNNGVPLIRIRDIFSKETENLYNGKFNEDFIVNNGDILIGMDGDFRVSKWPGKKGLLNQRVCRILFKSEFYNKQFLFVCIQPYLDAIHSETSAVTVKHLSSRTINNIPFPLPPLPIQRAIVSKIESLFSDLDNGIANLKKAQEQLKIYRQAVLKKAFEGALTKEWRDKQSNLPTAEVLLTQIKEERENLYNQQIEDWEKLVKDWEDNGKEGKKPTKPKAIKELPPLTEDELKELPELPDRWVWCNIGENFISLDQGWSPRCENYPSGEDEWGVIKTTAIQPNSFEQINNKKLPVNLKPKEQHELKNGDILITRAGPRVRVGVSCLVKNVRSKLINCDKAYRIRSVLTIPDFIVYLLNSPVFSREMEKTKSGISDSGLNLKQDIFLKMPIPLPPLREQQQIVQEIESRLSVCDKMEQSISESLEKANALRQSILKKAFEGKLLSEAEIEACKQETDYEPASVLLEKIKAERVKTQNSASQKKSKK